MPRPRDLGGFRSRQGKLLMYTGWDDPILPPLDIIDYYESVVARIMGGVARTSEFFRLFMVPGMGALQRWTRNNQLRYAAGARAMG